MLATQTTTSIHARFRQKDSDASKAHKTESFVTQLMDLEGRTERVCLYDVISKIDPQTGLMDGMSATSEGWNSIMSVMTPGLTPFINGWDRQLQPDQAREVQSACFNQTLEVVKDRLKEFTATIRRDGNIGVVEAVYSNRYQLKTNLDAFSDVANYVGDDVTMNALRLRGRQLRVDVGLSGMDKSIETPRAKEGEIIGTNLSMMNSEDRTLSYSFQLGVFMQHCTNGMVITKPYAQAKAKHLRGMDASLKKQLGNMDVSNSLPIIDMIQKSSKVMLEGKTFDNHRSWVARQESAKYAESVVNDKVAYRGYHGSAPKPSVFDVFCAITESAHQNTTDVAVAHREESLAHKYLEYAMT